jgi:uncharacterized protein (TIGR03000 family)
MLCRVLKHSYMALVAAVFLCAPALAEERRQEQQREPATIRVLLPEDARLTFDGESTVSTGASRLFVSPPLSRGREFTYTLRAERMRGDKSVVASKTITVRAGEETQVDLRSGYATVAEAVRGIEEAAEDRDDKPSAAPPGKGPRFNLEGFLKDYDKNKDGSLSRNEFPPELRPAFDRLDANKDGKVNGEELERGIAHLHPARRPSDLIHVLIEMSACDDVCHDELQRSYDILRKVDKNQDGKLDPDEVKAARLQIIKDRVDYLFAELDKNKDGKISRKEAKGMLLQDFDQIDRDKDGFLDRAELTRAASEHLEASAAAGSGLRPKTEAPKDN